MQSVRSRIWTRVAVSISYDDNHYTTGTSKIVSTTSIKSREYTNMSQQLEIYTHFSLNKQYEEEVQNTLYLVQPGNVKAIWLSYLPYQINIFLFCTSSSYCLFKEKCVYISSCWDMFVHSLLLILVVDTMCTISATGIKKKEYINILNVLGK